MATNPTQKDNADEVPPAVTKHRAVAGDHATW